MKYAVTKEITVKTTAIVVTRDLLVLIMELASVHDYKSR
jgi:hypothetical protein